MSFWYEGHPGKEQHRRQGCQPGCCLLSSRMCVCSGRHGRTGVGQSRHPTGATFQEESSFLGHKNPHTVSWRAWPLICPTSGPALGAPCPGGHVLAALQDLENCAGPGSYCPQHSEKCVGKPEMGEQSKPVTQEGMALWGAAKAWPCHFQGWGQPAPHSMRTD